MCSSFTIRSSAGSFKYKGILKRKGTTFNYLFDHKLHQVTWQVSVTPGQDECPHISVWLTLWGLAFLACGPWNKCCLCRWNLHAPDPPAGHHLPFNPTMGMPAWIQLLTVVTGMQLMSKSKWDQLYHVGTTTFYVLLQCYSKDFRDRTSING